MEACGRVLADQADALCFIGNAEAGMKMNRLKAGQRILSGSLRVLHCIVSQVMQSEALFCLSGRLETVPTVSGPPRCRGKQGSTVPGVKPLTDLGVVGMQGRHTLRSFQCRLEKDFLNGNGKRRMEAKEEKRF